MKFFLGALTGGAVVGVVFYLYNRFAASTAKYALAQAENTLQNIKLEYTKLKSGLSHNLDKLVSGIK